MYRSTLFNPKSRHPEGSKCFHTFMSQMQNHGAPPRTHQRRFISTKCPVMNSVLFSQTAEPSLRDPSSPIGFTTTTTTLLAQLRPCTGVTHPQPRRTPRTDAQMRNLELEAIRRCLFTGPDINTYLCQGLT